VAAAHWYGEVYCMVAGGAPEEGLSKIRVQTDVTCIRSLSERKIQISIGWVKKVQANNLLW
jgi:hypothetical protein